MSPRLIKLPPTLQYALERLEDFVDKPYKFGSITCNRPGKPRLMRRERRENVRKVLLALVRRMDLVSGRILRPLGPDKGVEVYADCSLNWLVRASGVSRRTLCRVIVDLESVGCRPSSLMRVFVRVTVSGGDDFLPILSFLSE